MATSDKTAAVFLAHILSQHAMHECFELKEWVNLSLISTDIKDAISNIYGFYTIFLTNTPIENLRSQVKKINLAWPSLSLGYRATKFHSDSLRSLHAFESLSEVEITRCQHISDLSPLSSLKRVCLSTCASVTDLSPLSRVRIIELNSCHNISDLSVLTFVQDLCVRRCFNATNVTNLSSLRKLTMEANNEHATIIHGLATVTSHLEEITLTNVGVHPSLSVLRTVPSVSLINFSSLSSTEDLAALEYVNSLTITKARITSVECFTNVKSIDLTGCWMLSDISSLEASKTLTELNLTDCTQISNVSSLGFLKKLVLRNCYRVSDVSSLGLLQDLDLTGCWGVADVSSLGNVSKLDLSLCGKVQDISSLRNVVDLTLVSNRHLKSLGDLNNFKKFSMTDCISIDDVSGLRNVPEVYINGCRKLVDLSPLANATQVSLLHCPSVKSVSSLSKVGVIIMRHCSSITDVSALRNVRKLVLERVPFEDAAELGTVVNLCIEECWGFSNCNALESVQTLRLNGCGCPRHVGTRQES